MRHKIILSVACFVGLALAGLRPVSAADCSNPYFPLRDGGVTVFQTAGEGDDRPADPYTGELRIQAVKPGTFRVSTVVSPDNRPNETALINSSELTCVGGKLTGSFFHGLLPWAEDSAAWRKANSVTRQSGVVLPAQFKIGTAWKQGYTQIRKLAARQTEKIVHTSRMRVVGQEEVTVPMGTYNAFVIEGASSHVYYLNNRRQRTEVYERKFWLVKDVGLVKFTVFDVTNDDESDEGDDTPGIPLWNMEATGHSFTIDPFVSSPVIAPVQVVVPMIEQPTPIIKYVPTVPKIVYPMNGQVLTDYPRLLTAKWTDTGAAKFLLQLECDYCVSASVKWSGQPTFYSVPDGATSFALPQLVGDNEFRLRVLGVDKSGVSSEWSDYVYFSFNTSAYAKQPTAPSIPSVISPSYKQLFNVYPRSFVARWTDVSASRYELEIVCDYCGSNSAQPWQGKPFVYAIENGATSFVVPALPGDNEYRLRVRGQDKNGAWSEWSEQTPFSFQTSNSLIPPSPVIVSPTAGQTLKNYPRTAEITWKGEGVRRYVVQIDCDYCESLNKWTSRPQFYSVDNFTNSFITPPLAGDNEFRVRVKAINDNEISSEWSEYVYFKYDTR